MDPIITVVIPVYNGERYVSRAVESVVNQPESGAIEVFVIDDGSRDQSAVICDKLAEKFENVCVIHKGNGGVSSARNLGIQRAKGKYIAFLDCDDWWQSGFLNAEMLREFTRNDSADVYQFAFREMDAFYCLERKYPVKEETIQYSQPGFGRYDWAHPCSFFHRISFLKKYELQYPASRVGEDGPFVEMALYWAASLKRINKILFTYWENGSSCVHSTPIVSKLKETYLALLQEQSYFERWAVPFDADVTFVWHTAENLPKICAICGFSTVNTFMKEYCLKILEKRPDIHFRQELWGRFEAWKKNALKFWCCNRIKVGIPLLIKGICYQIPGLRRIASYLYNRYHRGFQPIKSEPETM